MIVEIHPSAPICSQTFMESAIYLCPTFFDTAAVAFGLNDGKKSKIARFRAEMGLLKARRNATHRALTHVPPQDMYEERSTPVSHFIDSAAAAFNSNNSKKAKIARFSTEMGP